MNLKKLFGFLAKSSAKFSKRKGKILNSFMKMKGDLIKVIKEEESYVADLIKQRDEIKAEIVEANQSIDTSKRIVTKIENFLN